MKKLLLGMIGLALLVGGLFWACQKAFQPGTTYALPDGSRVVVRGVTYGTQHRAFTGLTGFWRVLPLSLVQRFAPKMVLSHTTAQPTLTVWWDRFGATPGTGDLQLRLADRTGYGIDSSGHILTSTRPDGSVLEGRVFMAFPRHDPEIVLQVLVREANFKPEEVVLEIPLKNPVHGPFPSWEAQSLPERRVDGDMEFALTRLVTGVGTARVMLPAENPMESYTVAFFEVKTNGVRSDAWEPSKVTTSDPTGNVLDCSSWSNWVTKEGEVAIRYRYGLYPAAGPWKLRVRFTRTKAFLPEELATIRGISLDENAESQVVKVGGREIMAEGGAQETEQKGVVMASVRFEIKDLPEEERLTLVRLVDDQGRKLETAGSSWGGGRFRYDLRLTNEVRRVDAVVAVHASRFAEFTVQPEWLQKPAIP